MSVLMIIMAMMVIMGDGGAIKHVVVLELENRSFDHLFGFLGAGTNGLTGKEYNRVIPGDVLSKKIFVDRNASFTAPCDPNHEFLVTALKEFGPLAVADGKIYSSEPSMGHFVEMEGILMNGSTDYCAVMKSQDPEKLTVSSFLALNYAVFDRFFASVPGPTWPNRMFLLSGQSAGDTATNGWYNGV